MLKRYNEIEDAKLEDFFNAHNVPPLPLPTLADALSLVESGVHETVADASEHLGHMWAMAEHLRRHPIRCKSLPPELSAATLMTRERFRAGIRIFITNYRKICKP